MAKVTSATLIASLEVRIASLEAQLLLTNEVAANQRKRILVLEQQAVTNSTVHKHSVVGNNVPVITHYSDSNGTMFRKTRVGNRSVITRLDN